MRTAKIMTIGMCNDGNAHIVEKHNNRRTHTETLNTNIKEKKRELGFKNYYKIVGNEKKRISFKQYMKFKNSGFEKFLVCEQ